MIYELHAREAGTGQPVVLLPPFPFDASVYDAILDAARDGRLAARVIVLDFPGFGLTPLPVPAPEVLAVDDLADSVARSITEAGLGSTILGGVAIGGYVALEVARRHPGRVEGLILMGCKALPDAPANRPDRESVAALARAEGSAAVAERLHAAPLGLDATDELRAASRRVIAAAQPEAIAALVMGLADRPDPASTLAALDIPVLFIAGLADPFTKIEDAHAAAALLRHGTLVELPAVGHIAPLEAPDAVIDAIAAFVAGMVRP